MKPLLARPRRALRHLQVRPASAPWCCARRCCYSGQCTPTCQPAQQPSEQGRSLTRSGRGTGSPPSQDRAPAPAPSPLVAGWGVCGHFRWCSGVSGAVHRARLGRVPGHQRFGRSLAGPGPDGCWSWARLRPSASHAPHHDLAGLCVHLSRSPDDVDQRLRLRGDLPLASRDGRLQLRIGVNQLRRVHLASSLRDWISLRVPHGRTPCRIRSMTPKASLDAASRCFRSLIGPHWLAEVQRDYVSDPAQEAFVFRDVVAPSATVRTPVTVTITRTSLTVTYPQQGASHTFRYADLGWTSGIVQFGHHSYNPTKDGLNGGSRHPQYLALGQHRHQPGTSVLPAPGQPGTQRRRQRHDHPGRTSTSRRRPQARRRL